MLLSNIKEILKIKENFPSLSTKKIEEIHKTINEPRKDKLKFNMTTKEPSRRQVLVPMSLINSSKFMVSSSHYIANINRALKDIKSNTLANFIHVDQYGLTVTTNKVASLLNLSTSERYIKNVDTINSEENMISKLPQSKSYLKILGISYIMERTNVSITLL